MAELVRTVVLTNGIALTGSGLREMPFRTLRLVDGAIAELSDRVEDDSVIPTAEVHDIGGAYVVPGLVDAHVHFDLAAQPAAYVRWADPDAGLTRALTCLHNGLVALRSGITAVRDLGCVDRLVIDYATQVTDGLLLGPRIIAAGRPITITGGHCSQYGRTASGAVDVREAVREQIAVGARVIKIMATGGISTPGNPGTSQFTAEELHAAVEEAHKFGLQVAAHAHAADGIKMALQAGVDTIEHAGFADQASLEMIKSCGATLVPTVTALNNIAHGVGIPPATVRKSLAARETYRMNTAKAINAGVHIAAGTDAGTALNPIGGLLDELVMYTERGMTPIDALRSATVHAGPLVEAKLGRIDVGYKADLLVVADDPRSNLSTLRAPKAVLARGRLVPLPWVEETIDRLRDVVTA